MTDANAQERKLALRILDRFGDRETMPWTVSYMQACLQAMGHRPSEHRARRLRNWLVAKGYLQPYDTYVPKLPNGRSDQDGLKEHCSYLIYLVVNPRASASAQPKSDDLCPQNDVRQDPFDAWAKLLGVT